VGRQGEEGQLQLTKGTACRDGQLALTIAAATSETQVQAANTTENAEPILRLRGIGRRFGGLRAVDGVDLDVAAGERRAILGPNGAGKTTLFNVISGEFPPSDGTIELFGSDVTHSPARKRAGMGLARTFQQSRLFEGLSVDDNLYLAALGVRSGHTFPFRSSKRDAPLRAEARATAAAVGLGHRLGALVSELSHGERRQLEVGMARASGPKLMMLDEPAAGLSPTERQTLTELLLALEPAITLLLIEHDMDVALRVAQWVTIMHDGRIVAEGTPAEIRANQMVHELYLGSHYYDE
jgi:branched-chain amino acid transport system ATP-binding protein